MPYRAIAAFLAACLTFGGGSAGAGDARPSAAQVEQMLLDVPTAQGALDDSAHLNAEAHYPGSRGDYDMAIWMRDQLRSYGFQAEIEPVKAPVPVLHRAILQLLVTPHVDFDLRETRIARDPDGWRNDSGVPFNAWSGSGDITAPLVYANHGLDADYRTLARAGISVRGRIVLIRYGAEFRGRLADRAQDEGAAGVIFYSDPAARDGSDHGPAYPDGPYRPLGSVQRGSVGDTPRVRIPVLPVSALTARRLLQDVTGAAPPHGWRGGLGASYALGTTRALVRLRVDETSQPIWLWNTVGTLAGRDSSHEVILGGHRDAWVYGVTDNGSGISTLLEAARALGYAYRSGWRPDVSIVIAGWDGEEIGEVGSDTFVRTHYQQLARGCIAYVNADETATGNTFYAAGSAALAGVLPAATRLVGDPLQPAEPLWDAWRSQPGGVAMRAPGGGSDHEPFLYLAGIPTLEFGFSGPFGVYHSAYDDLRYATTQADPSFAHHRSLAQLLALSAFALSAPTPRYTLGAFVRPMLQALAQLRAASHADVAPIAQAIDRFAARVATGHDTGPQAIVDAVHRLDQLFYGRNGYRPVAFPYLAGAIAKGDPTDVTRAVAATAATLDAIAGAL
jgi:N-acetylated-alpha-linked acidic dipeptidase